MEENPVVTILLRNRKIVPVAERDIGRKNSFLLCSEPQSFYFAAAKPDVLIKWLYAFDAIVPWYYSGNVELENCFQEDVEAKKAVEDHRYTTRRTRTVPSITRIRSKKKLTNLLDESGSNDPFPGIRLKTTQEDFSTASDPSVNSNSQEPFPGIKLKTEGDRDKDVKLGKAPRSPQPIR